MAQSRSGGAALTARFVEQATQVSEMLDAGYSNRRIAEVLGVSAPRISQIRQQLPEVAPYLGTADPLGRLRGHREQLTSLRRQTLMLAATIRRDLSSLEEELEAADIDHLLGLRS